MPSSLHLDHASLTALLRRWLPAGGMVGGITVVPADGAVMLTLEKVRTGLSVFGMAIPAIDADLSITGVWSDQSLCLRWNILDLRGVPPMAAKLIGKPAVARMLIEALGTTWGFDAALSVDDAGDLVLCPERLRVSLLDGITITGASIPGSGDAALVVDFLISKSV